MLFFNKKTEIAFENEIVICFGFDRKKDFCNLHKSFSKNSIV